MNTPQKPQLHKHSVSLSNFFDIQQKLIGEVIDEINKKKDAVIMQRFAELGIDIDIEAEKRRRFKRFVVEHSETEETYWYNDGSESGLRIITFKKWQPNYDMKNPNNTITCEVSYY
jgi:hypothetical protein